MLPMPVMERMPRTMSKAAGDFDPALKSVVAALARACELLEAGDLAAATKWTAIAAALGETDNRPETN